MRGYLHNVHHIALGTAGLVLATTGVAALVAGPIVGAVVDRWGARLALGGAMVVSAIGFGGYAFVHTPAHAFALAVLAGFGNGAFWPGHAALVGGLTEREGPHNAYAMQRVLNNLGIGVGSVVGGLIATTAHPSTYELQDIFPAFAKNDAGVTERGIGFAFLANTLVIVVAQLPVAKALESRRRMLAYVVEGALWATAWLIVFGGGPWLAGTGAAIVFGVALGIVAAAAALGGGAAALLLERFIPAPLRRTPRQTATVARAEAA